MVNINSNQIILAILSKFSKWDISLSDVRRFLSYLRYYGYFDGVLELTIGDVVDAILKFQEVAGLTKDGELGPKTLKAMSWPRCGCKDFGEALNVEKSSWGKKNLTFYIDRRDNDLSAKDWDWAIEKSFSQWSDVADLKFSRVTRSNDANFIITIGSGRADGFDGPSGTLAWAQLPPRNNYTGQLVSKADASETWIIDTSKNGILLVNVMTHEIGHLLGLQHSKVDSALMAPFYKRSIDKPQQRDDISRIQAIYGKPKVDPVPPDPNPDPDPDPDIPTPTPGSDHITIIVKGSIDSVAIPGYRINKIG